MVQLSLLQKIVEVTYELHHKNIDCELQLTRLCVIAFSLLPFTNFILNSL